MECRVSPGWLNFRQGKFIHLNLIIMEDFMKSWMFEISFYNDLISKNQIYYWGKYICWRNEVIPLADFSAGKFDSYLTCCWRNRWKLLKLQFRCLILYEIYNSLGTKIRRWINLQILILLEKNLVRSMVSDMEDPNHFQLLSEIERPANQGGSNHIRLGDIV